MPVFPAQAGTQPKDTEVHEATLRLHPGQPPNGTLHTGVTSDLIRRVHEHRPEVVRGFTSRYQVHTLVWFEQHGTMETAIARDKAIKEWKRARKIELIEATNRNWLDLYPGLVQLGPGFRRDDD